ncbi:PAS domain S-box protein [Aliiglaciecola sp. CAU 1673]|uniref:hybrid sensor histidine kinase/response regulator n=1 Tax=Aliiglaciecola sp. CAU 1673 TaxID=3032595 RepID=UPI0023DCDED3|nr:PAS domain-containing sensor histidine kinase [Aliiglaciecola sp. CAU 1673]MDF2179147.1 PAS domain S-box protein [Aliiglaciecola sp. CAU 1673]
MAYDEEESLAKQLLHEKSKLLQLQKMAKMLTIEFNSDNFCQGSQYIYDFFEIPRREGGFSKEEFAAAFPKKYQQELRSALYEYEGTQLTHINISFVNPRYQRRFLSCSIDAQVEQTLVVIQDISERVTAENFSRQSQHSLDIFLSHVAEAVITINEEGKIGRFNPAAEQMFQYSASEVIGRNVRILMPEPYASEHDEYIHRFLETSESKVIGKNRELVAKRKDGETFPIFLRVAELTKDTNSAIMGGARFLATVQDLSVWNKQQEAVQRSYRMESLGQLAGGIAHDFNNMLGVLSVNLDLLGQANLSEAQVTRLERCNRSVDKAKRLTRKFLQFSRKNMQHARVVDAVALTNGMHDILHRLLPDRIAFRIITPPLTLPIFIDQDDFEDCITNLVINARDAISDTGQIIVKVFPPTPLSNEESFYLPGNRDTIGRYIRLDITDTGCGIPKDKLHSIFHPFYTTKKKDKGTGLGLSMVYAFVNRSNGLVAVKSGPGDGTCMSIFLPEADHKQLICSDESQSSKVSDISLFKSEGEEKILVIEDNLDVLASTADTLRSLNYQVITSNSSEYVENILDCDPAINHVLSDINIPNAMSGLQLYELLKSKNRAIKFGLMTGYSEQLLKDWPKDVKEKMVLDKPFSAFELARFVSQMDKLNT